MMQAQLEDGRILEFPDGTDPAVIQSTVKKLLGVENGDIADTDVDMVGRPESGGAISRFVEPAATLITSAIAEPIAGLAGITQAVNPFAKTGAGERAVAATREALTFQPRTETGQAGLQAVGEALEPIAEKLGEAEKFLGDKTFEATGSPALAAAAATIPTALMEILGIKGGKGVVKASQAGKKAIKESRVAKSILDAVPSVDQLKAASREVFKEIDNLGISLQPKAYRGLVNKLQIEAKRMGIDPDVTPKSSKALSRFTEFDGVSPTLTEIDIMRKVAQNAAKSIEPSEAAIGAAMINTVDTFLDNVRPTALKRPEGVPGIGKRYKVARDLWGRARRSEVLGEAFKSARLQASGFENGLRTQFRAILNNKNKRRFFKKDELAAMRRVVEGSRKENIARLIGKLGFSDGASTQLIGGSLGVGAGAMVGGAPGAVAVPLIGQVSKSLAKRMTAKNAEFADQVIRAGKDAKKITRAYMKNTPKAERSAAELSELLMRNDIDLSLIPDDDIAKQAAMIASQNRVALAGAVAVSGDE